MVSKDRFFDEGIQRFLSLLHDSQFQKIAEALEGYDTSMSGKMVFPQNSKSEE